MTNSKTLFVLTLILCAFLAVGSLGGLFFEKELYGQNIPLYVVSTVGADLGNLFVIIPVLIITAVMVMKHSQKAFIVWFGAMMYALYLCFYNFVTLRFNHLFLLYVVEVGLVFYSLFIAVASVDPEKFKSAYASRVGTRSTIIFLALFGIFFIVLWLVEIIPAMIAGSLPESVSSQGLITPVFHGLDLGIFFPGFVIAAVLLIKKHAMAYLLAPAFMAYSVIMSLCLVWLTVATAIKGMGLLLSDIALYGIAALISLFFLINFMKHFTPAPVSA